MLSYGYFQVYSNIKRSIYYRLDKLLTTKGVIIVALALPKTKANISSIYIRVKY